jgi:hypothetical protein
MDGGSFELGGEAGTVISSGSLQSSKGFLTLSASASPNLKSKTFPPNPVETETIIFPVIS